jgi:hypothetical protein
MENVTVHRCPKHICYVISFDTRGDQMKHFLKTVSDSLGACFIASIWVLIVACFFIGIGLLFVFRPLFNLLLRPFATPMRRENDDIIL